MNATVTAIEEARKRVALPQSFDGTPDSVARFAGMVTKKFGPEWTVVSTSLETRTAVIMQRREVREVRSSGVLNELEVALPSSSKVADGPRVAAEEERDNPGYVMVRFLPFLGRAVLAKLDPELAAVRRLIGRALGCALWEVQVSVVQDADTLQLKRYEVDLPASFVPAKHMAALDLAVRGDPEAEWAEGSRLAVGHSGWSVEVDALALTAKLIPGDLPTFPGLIPYPFEAKKLELLKLPFGRELISGQDAVIDLSATSHVAVMGSSGGGKGVTVRNVIASALARNYRLTIVDVVKGGPDYRWAEHYCSRGGWGCPPSTWQDDEKLAFALAALRNASKDAERTLKLIAEHKVEKWQQLPADVIKANDIRPHLVVIEELVTMTTLEATPSGLGKDHPRVIAVLGRNLMRYELISLISTIALVYRSAGQHLCLVSQRLDASKALKNFRSGVAGSLSARILLGANPPDADRRVAFSSVAGAPKVPVHVRRDANAARGSGVYEAEGRETSVIKSFFSPAEEMETFLRSLGLVERSDAYVRPTDAEVAAAGEMDLDGSGSGGSMSAKFEAMDPEELVTLIDQMQAVLARKEGPKGSKRKPSSDPDDDWSPDER